MKNFYQAILIFSILIAVTTSSQATSKLYQTEGSIVIKDNTPCFYVESQGISIQGIEMYEDGLKREAWSDWDIKIPASEDKCIYLGGQKYSFQESKLYRVWTGGAPGITSYAMSSFCLSTDDKGKYYLAEIINGKCSKNPLHVKNKKTLWQRLFE